MTLESDIEDGEETDAPVDDPLRNEGLHPSSAGLHARRARRLLMEHYMRYYGSPIANPWDCPHNNPLGLSSPDGDHLQERQQAPSVSISLPDDDDDESPNSGEKSHRGETVSHPIEEDDLEKKESSSCNGETNPYTRKGAPDSKYDSYPLDVDPSQDDRAIEIPLYSASRPHMRAFHLAWTSFFVAFFVWFAIAPLLSEIEDSLQLTRKDIWNSSVLAVASSALTRILIGPLNDKYGARGIMSGTLVAAAIPTGLVGLVVQGPRSLCIVRFFIGLAGSAFVTCQYWTSSMFSKEIAGTANALAAGWGNLGGGVAQIVMGSLLFPLFKAIYQGDSEKAWRTVFIFPALLSIAMAFMVVKYGDDTPKGNVRRCRRQNMIEPVSATQSLRQGSFNRNTWLLFLQYGCCFGVEITMTQAAALYFKDNFGQSTEGAAAIASVFGWMNLFARGIGGFCSDMANAHAGLRGRLWCQVVALVVEGCLVIVFSYTHTLAGAIIVMVLFSVFVQLAEGSTFGIVPYIDSTVTGSVAGLIGAGGNVGGVGFALLFREFDYRSAFLWMGCTVVASAFWTGMISIPGHSRLIGGTDAPEILERRQKARFPDVIMIETNALDVTMSTHGGDEPEETDHL